MRLFTLAGIVGAGGEEGGGDEISVVYTIVLTISSLFTQRLEKCRLPTSLPMQLAGDPRDVGEKKKKK